MHPSMPCFPSIVHRADHSHLADMYKDRGTNETDEHEHHHHLWDICCTQTHGTFVTRGTLKNTRWTNVLEAKADGEACTMHIGRYLHCSGLCFLHEHAHLSVSLH